jgi:hypothetical protein
LSNKRKKCTLLFFYRCELNIKKYIYGSVEGEPFHEKKLLASKGCCLFLQGAEGGEALVPLYWREAVAAH